MTPGEFFAKWCAERERLGRYGQRVDPVPLLDDVLCDARSAFEEHGLESLTLTQAAAESGYSIGHLGRLTRDGVIPNAGRRNAPRILRKDLPRKIRGLPQPTGGAHIEFTSKRQIVRSIANPERRSSR